jgi:hypothetical protein
VSGDSQESAGPRVEGRAEDVNTSVCSSPRASARLPRLFAAAVALALLGLLALGSSALAAGETSYVLGSSVAYGCSMTEPGAVATNETTGDFYVLDRATGLVSHRKPNGECVTITPPEAKPLPKTGVGGIAVDNSSASPSFGDLYVSVRSKSGTEPVETVDKFDAEGTFLSAVANEFELIHGIGVDTTGKLWVYEGKLEEAKLESFTNATVNVLVEAIELQIACLPRRGLAVGPNAESFYIVAGRENRQEKCENTVPVAVKLNGAGETETSSVGTGEPGGPAFFAQLDNDATTGLGVNPATGEVFFDHGTYVNAFSPSGLFVQRFGDEPGPAALQAGTGVAVNGASSSVYVIDAREGGVLDTFVPKSFEELTPEQRELSDGRAWEQVTPENKLGASLYSISKFFGQVQASEDGNAITYTSNAPIVTNPPTNRAPEPAQNLSRRGSSSWSVEDILPPAGDQAAGYAGSTGTFYETFTYDLSAGFMTPAEHEKVTATEPRLSPEATESAPFKRDLTRPSSECEPVPSTCYLALVSSQNETSEVPFGAINGLAQVRLTNAIPDGHDAVLLSSVPLTPEGVTQNEPEGLYEWATGGELKLVSVFPSGEGPGEAGQQLRLGGPGENNGSIMRNAISTCPQGHPSPCAEDGTRVVWSTGAGTERLYLRDTAKGETIRLDSREGLIKQPKAGRAIYQTASADTRRIFFTDVSPLTSNATTEKGEEAEEEAENRGFGDLYVCEVPSEAPNLECHLKDLTAEVKASNEEAGVQGVIGANEEGTTVYFVADANLGAHGAAGNCVPRAGAEAEEERAGLIKSGQCSLYVEHFNGTEWEAPVFIASLSSLDENDWAAPVVAGGLSKLTSRVSPKGGYLAFMSLRSLTGYNNVDVNPVAKGARDEEVFLYSEAAGKIQCVSCKAGGPPQGVFDTEGSGEGAGLLIDRPENWREMWVAANIPGWTGRSISAAVYQSRYLSDSGRLFFNSADALVPAAEGALRKEKVHGVETSVGVSNVYEFEPNGVGDCASEHGCVSLLSGGASKQESAFLDASTSGNDVFFLTQQALAATDHDAVIDLYDARVCTIGSPCITAPPEPPKPCSGEACKGSVTTVPAAPGSPPTTQPGPGNIGAKIEVRGEEAKKPPVVKKPPPLSRAQKLKKALKKCAKIKNKKKHAACVKAAKKKYGPLKKKGKR